MYSLLVAPSDQLKTLQSSADQMQNVKILLIFLLSYALLVGLINLFFYFIYKKSPDLRLNFLKPKLDFKKKNILFNIEDQLGRPLGFTKCTIYQGEKINKIVYPWTSRFGVKLTQGKYSITLSRFGYISASTDEFEVGKEKLDFDLQLKASEDVIEARGLGNLAYVILTLTLILFISSLSVYFLNFLELELAIQLVVLLLTSASGYLLWRYYRLTRFIETRSFKNRLLKNEIIEVFGRNREPLKKITTSKTGTIIILMSPGIYKFSPEKYSGRSVRIFETGLGNFKIKF